MRLVAYTRVSVSNPNDSLVAQEEACRAWAEVNGHEVVAVFSDDGRSGTLSEVERPGLGAALAAIQDNEAEGIIARDQSRYGRALHVTEAFYAATWNAGGRVFDSFTGEIPESDPLDPTRELIRTVLSAVHAFERNVIVARLVSGKRRSLAAGKTGGGATRYGFDLTDDGYLVPNEAQQRLIARARKLHGQGKSLREISQAVFAGDKHPESVRRLLRA